LYSCVRQILLIIIYRAHLLDKKKPAPIRGGFFNTVKTSMPDASDLNLFDLQSAARAVECQAKYQHADTKECH